MKTIHKYPLEYVERQTIALPKGCHTLCVQIQDGEPCLWAVVNPKKPKIDCTIIMSGTGAHDALQFKTDPREVRYLGTVQTRGCVWHYFVKLEPYTRK